MSRCQESLGVGVESLKEFIQRLVASGIGPTKAVMFLKLKALKRGLLSNEGQSIGSILFKRSTDDSGGAV